MESVERGESDAPAHASKWGYESARYAPGELLKLGRWASKEEEHSVLNMLWLALQFWPRIFALAGTQPFQDKASSSHYGQRDDRARGVALQPASILQLLRVCIR